VRIDPGHNPEQRPNSIALTAAGREHSAGRPSQPTVLAHPGPRGYQRGSNAVCTSNSPKPFNELVRQRRLELGLTQSELAERAGCSQSAVSMFERGYGDVLSSDRLKVLAEVLDLDPGQARPPQGETARGAQREVWKFCPAPECPSNAPYAVAGRLCFRPTCRRAPDGKKTYCRDCGELLESRCPNPECRSEITPGAFCPECGTAYVSAMFASDAEPIDPSMWATQRRREIAELRSLTTP